MNKEKRRSDCPINLSLEIFGDKWTLLIFRDMVFFDNRHFNEFVTIEKISTNILTDRLSRLTEHKLLKKAIDENNRSAYIYSLTNKGLNLVPLLFEIYYWGAIYTEKNNSTPEIIERLVNKKDAVIQEHMDKLRISHRIR